MPIILMYAHHAPVIAVIDAVKIGSYSIASGLVLEYRNIVWIGSTVKGRYVTSTGRAPLVYYHKRGCTAYLTSICST